MNDSFACSDVRQVFRLETAVCIRHVWRALPARHRRCGLGEAAATGGARHIPGTTAVEGGGSIISRTPLRNFPNDSLNAAT